MIFKGLSMKQIVQLFLEGESPTLTKDKKLKIKTAFKHSLSHDIKSHPLTININLFKQININQNVWQNPNDPDDESEHFKQPHIAIEQSSPLFYIDILIA